MKRHAVKSIDLNVPAARAFDFVADPRQLPRWAHAFASVREGRALMRTPQGEVEVGLEVLAEPVRGTVDWRMSFPDGTVASAFSRIVPADEERSIMSFVLPPPPTALEDLEGTLREQERTLESELRNVRRLLEDERPG